jgi:transposase
MARAKLTGTKSGRKIGRPKPDLPERFKAYYDLMQSGAMTKVEMAKQLGKGRATVYRWIEQYKSR